MAETTGFVQRMAWSPSFVFTWIGSSPTSTELLYLRFSSSDTASELDFKRNMANMLSSAKHAGYPVRVGHPDDDDEILYVRFGAFNISTVGQAVHNDFYSVTGSGIPADVEVEFESATMTVSITPDLVRPHWVFIDALPTAIPTGRNMVRLRSPGWTSDSVPVDVSAQPISPVRVLYSGQPKARPYTMVFIANPGIQTEGGVFISDPVLTNRTDYHRVVGYCLRNLLTVTEDLLRRGDWDRQMRFVSIFDTTLGANDANSLAHEVSPNIMETRRSKLNSVLSRFSETADMVFVIHGSTTHDRASAWFTTDNAAGPSTAYTYDGVSRVHRHIPSIPGSAALPLDMDQTGLTPLHEYGHGASDFNNGLVIDLYVDGVSGFAVNKKGRTRSTDPIPTNFATYNGTNFLSDKNRDGLGYPATWTSFHPELADSAHPNLMDNYWLAAGGNPQVCRLDRLTSTWFVDRLRAKLGR